MILARSLWRQPSRRSTRLGSGWWPFGVTTRHSTPSFAAATISEVTTFANAALQLKGESAGRAAVRFVNNVMFGFGGLYDITAANGIFQVKEDFGQTLGYWGVGDGPYLVLPLLGPSNLRDATGLVVDNVGFGVLVPAGVSSSPAYIATAYGLQPVDKRNSIPFRYYRSGSPFEYELVRVIYTRYRDAAIAR